MTEQQVVEKYKISVSSLTRNFKRTQESILKRYGIKIIKEGRGSSAVYKEEVINDNRADSMFQVAVPAQQAGIMKNDLNLTNFTFQTFLGVVTTPMLVFRGSYVDFLKYIGAPVSEGNIEKLKEAIENLVGVGILGAMYDRSTEIEIVTLSIIRAAEIDMKLGMNMLVTCKMLAAQNKKRDWISLLKVWLGIELLSKKDTYTQADLIELTGLNRVMIESCMKILKENNICLSNKIYIKGSYYCIGTKTTMNQEDF